MRNIKTTTQTPPLHSAKIVLQLVPGTEAELHRHACWHQQLCWKIALMAAGTGTTHSPSGLREHMARPHKVVPYFKKAKGQFRPMFSSYFPFQDLCKSSSGGTDNCVANSAVLTVDQFCLATSHGSKNPHIPLKNTETLLKNVMLPFFF